MADFSRCPTPHINTTPEKFGKTVLMPGDPLRAKFIAETYLENPQLVNNVRGVNGYTGTWNGTKISVMASGMGGPSIGIYSFELYNFFGVDNIIRIGSAGAMQKDIHVRELVIGMAASTDSSYPTLFGLPGTVAPVADFDLLQTAHEVCREQGKTDHVGALFSCEAYYSEDPDQLSKWAKMGILAVEMEASTLYLNAAKAGKRALAICTVSNHIMTGEELPVEERERGFTDMVEVALEVARRMEQKPL